MLKVLSLEQSEQWDTIVRSFREYDVYWLSGYVKAFYLHGDGDPLLFYYDGGDTRGINVVMKRDVSKDVRFSGKIPESRFFDFSTPYGYGGWLIEGDDTNGLFLDYELWTKKNGIISEFVRFHPLIRNHEKCCGFYDVVQLGEVVHMELSSPEAIWNNITSKNRNMIRKAIKNEVKVYNGRFPRIIDEFRLMYNKTMDKNNAEKYYYFNPDFYASILDDLPHNAQIFWAEKDDLIIDAAIILTANGRMNYHLSGSLYEYRSYASGNLILFKAALWGYANGCRTFYLGGGVGSDNDSLLRFKKSFNKDESCRFYIGKRVFDPEKYDELVNMRELPNSEFFPRYRA